jgi:hypothetical protein
MGTDLICRKKTQKTQKVGTARRAVRFPNRERREPRENLFIRSLPRRSEQRRDDADFWEGRHHVVPPKKNPTTKKSLCPLRLFAAN